MKNAAIGAITMSMTPIDYSFLARRNAHPKTMAHATNAAAPRPYENGREPTN